MGLIQDWLRKKREEKELKNSYSKGKLIEEDYERKKLSSDERELNRFREEERRKRIKQQLERYRRMENDKIWRGKQGNPVYAKNITANHKKLFSGKNMFAEMPNITKEKNMFMKR